MHYGAHHISVVCSQCVSNKCCDVHVTTLVYFDFHFHFHFIFLFSFSLPLSLLFNHSSEGMEW